MQTNEAMFRTYVGHHYLDPAIGLCSRLGYDCIDSSFFFNDTATTEIYTLSLHDALPIPVTVIPWALHAPPRPVGHDAPMSATRDDGDRKSTRLNSSHLGISYAVFCL